MPLDKTKEGQYILEIPLGSTGVIKVFIDPSSGVDAGDARRLIQQRTITKSQAEDFIHVDEFAKRKGQPYWRFFDLGTRLRVVETASEWAELTIPLDDTDNTPVITEDGILEYAELDYVALGEFTGRLYADDIPASGYDIYTCIGAENIQMGPQNYADVLAFDQYTLGLHDPEAEEGHGPIDPFGFSHYDPELHEQYRLIPHCLPLWYGPTNQAEEENYIQSRGKMNHDIFDIVLKSVADPETTVTYPNCIYREEVDDICRTDSASGSSPIIAELWAEMDRFANPYWQVADDGGSTKKIVTERQPYENWNPKLLTQNSRDISNWGIMNLKNDVDEPLPSDTYYPIINSRLQYESFDTSDTTNFKVTTQPDFDADEVTLTVAKGSDLRFYLVPRMYGWAIDLFMYCQAVYDYESYRIYNPAFTPPRPRIENWITIGGGSAVLISGPGGFLGGDLSSRFFHLNNDFDPDIVYDGVLQTFTMNMFTGEWTLAGIINSSGTVGYSGGTPEGGGLFFGIDPISDGNFTFSMSPNGGRSSSAANASVYQVTWNIDMFWDSSSFGSGIGTSVNVYRGVHIGRCPVVPKTVLHDNGFGWWSPVSWSGYNPDNDDVQPDGVTIVPYDPDIAKTLEGRALLWFPENGISLEDIYLRTRDPNVLLHTDKVYSQWTANFVSYISPITIADGQPANESVDVILDVSLPDVEAPIASMEGLIQDDTQRLYDEAIAVLSPQPHIRNLEEVSGPSDVENGNQWGAILVAIDGKAGQLAGVIIKGGTKYYIWRKTDEDRGGYDIDGRPHARLDVFMDNPIPPYE